MSEIAVEGPRRPAEPWWSWLILSGTIGERWEASRGFTTGFNYIRISLATAVIFAHCHAVTFGQGHHIFARTAATSHGATTVLSPPLIQPLAWAVLPAFFALSGFLVAASLMRSGTTEFLLLRVLRIVPALAVETFLAALLMGPLVTEVPLRDYFSSPEFWSYPRNIIGDIHYLLPGVFVHNPWPRIVNSQLWTIPAELRCYEVLIVVSILAALLSCVGVKRERSIVVLSTLAAIAYFAALQIFEPAQHWSDGVSTVGVATLLLAFLVGVVAYNFRRFIPLGPVLFVASCAATYVLLWNGNFIYLATIPATYATVYIGLMNIPKTFVTATGDYSYGVYLYGFSLQQLIAYLLPHNQSSLLNFGLGLTLALICAAFSWHFVESQILGHKKKIIVGVLSAVPWLKRI